MRRLTLLLLVLGSGACIVENGGGGTEAADSPTPSPTATTPAPTPTPTPTPGHALHFSLSWPAQYTQADLDLHVLETNGSLWSTTTDCFFADCKALPTLEWGAAGATDNPVLDIDNITEAVPENVNIQEAATGTYSANAVYYGDHGAGAGGVDATMTIFVDGVTEYSHTFHFTTVNEYFDFANVVVTSSSATVVPVEQAGQTVPM